MPQTKSRRAIHLLWVLALMSGGPTFAKSVKGADVQQPLTVRRQGQTWTVTLAPALQRAIGTHFPGYALPPTQAFSPDLLQFLSQEPKKRDVVPFACTGDFDGNGLMDAALLLRKQGQWRLIAFHQTPPGSFRAYPIGSKAGFPGVGAANGTDGKVHLYIERVPKGQQRAPQLPHDGIQCEWFGQASRLFSWQRDHYQYVQTGD